MRIAVVTQYFWPETFRINELCEMLVERGHQVTVLTGVPNYPDGKVFDEYRRDPEKYRRLGDIDVVRVPMLPRGEGSAQLVANYVTYALSAVTIGVWRLRGRPFDVILAHQASPVTVGYPAMVLRRLRRIPSCMWILDLWPETPKALGVLPNRSAERVVEWGVRQIYASTDLLLVQSPGFESAVRKYAPASARVAYMPSWSDAVFDVGSVAPAPEVSRRPDLFTVLFAGNIGEAQDFPNVLAAAELLRNKSVRFVIVGDGRHAEWLKREVERRELAEYVLLPGRFPVDRMPSFFAHADALLVSLRPDPVFSLTIPAKVQAYMAAGLPIVASLDGEGAEAIRRSECGLVAAAGKPHELEAAIEQLASMSPTERAQLGENGRRGAETEFDRHRIIDELCERMEDLVRGADGG